MRIPIVRVVRGAWVLVHPRVSLFFCVADHREINDFLHLACGGPRILAPAFNVAALHRLAGFFLHRLGLGDFFRHVRDRSAGASPSRIPDHQNPRQDDGERDAAGRDLHLR